MQQRNVEHNLLYVGLLVNYAKGNRYWPEMPT